MRPAAGALSLAVLAAASASAPPPPSPPGLVGTWARYTNALPALQLPQVPLLGNGHLGVALDARDDGHGGGGGASGLGPGAANSLDLWLNTNALWSCTSCGTTDPDRTVPACCSTVALGGLSLRAAGLGASSPPPAFSAAQAIAADYWLRAS